jgi:hypothetical protein
MKTFNSANVVIQQSAASQAIVTHIDKLKLFVGQPPADFTTNSETLVSNDTSTPLCDEQDNADATESTEQYTHSSHPHQHHQSNFTHVPEVRRDVVTIEAIVIAAHLQNTTTMCAKCLDFLDCFFSCRYHIHNSSILHSVIQQFIDWHSKLNTFLVCSRPAFSAVRHPWRRQPDSKSNGYSHHRSHHLNSMSKVNGIHNAS